MNFISRGISPAILRPLPSNPPIARRTVGGTPRSGSGEDLPAELQGKLRFGILGRLLFQAA